MSGKSPLLLDKFKVCPVQSKHCSFVIQTIDLMSFKLLPAVFLIFNSMMLFSQELPLKKVKISKELTMSLPEELQPMTGQERRQKYVSDREPIAMYTNQDGTVDFGINQNSSSWSSSDYGVLRDFYRAGILNLYDEVDFYQDTLKEINGRAYIVFEFRGIVYGKEESFKGTQALSKYIHIMYTLKDDRVLLFNFSAPYSQRRRWDRTVALMMNSIQIK